MLWYCGWLQRASQISSSQRAWCGTCEWFCFPLLRDWFCSKGKSSRTSFRAFIHRSRYHVETTQNRFPTLWFCGRSHYPKWAFILRHCRVLYLMYLRLLVTVQTGLITALVATLDLIFYLANVSLRYIRGFVALTIIKANWNVSFLPFFFNKSYWKNNSGTLCSTSLYANYIPTLSWAASIHGMGGGSPQRRQGQPCCNRKEIWG